MSSPKRSIEPRPEDSKKRQNLADTEYYLNRWTYSPIVDPLLKELYNDLRSRLSAYPSNLICYEIDPRVCSGFRIPPATVQVSDHYTNKNQLVHAIADYPSYGDPDGETARNVGIGTQGATPYLGVRGEILLLLEFNKRIITLDKDGNEIGSFVIQLPDTAGRPPHPTGLAVYSNGDIAVAFLSDKPLAVFSPRGEFLRFIETLLPGYKPTPLQSGDQSISIDEKDVLYCAMKQALYPIRTFSPDGSFLREIDLPSYSGMPGGYLYNNRIVARRGRLYIGVGNILWVVDVLTDKLLWFMKYDATSFDVDGSHRIVIVPKYATPKIHLVESPADGERDKVVHVVIPDTGNRVSGLCVDTNANIWLRTEESFKKPTVQCFSPVKPSPVVTTASE